MQVYHKVSRPESELKCILYVTICIGGVSCNLTLYSSPRSTVRHCHRIARYSPPPRPKKSQKRRLRSRHRIYKKAARPKIPAPTAPKAGIATLLAASPESLEPAALAVSSAASLATEAAREVKLPTSVPYSDVIEAISEAYSEVMDARAEVKEGSEATDAATLEAAERADWKSEAVRKAVASESSESRS